MSFGLKSTPANQHQHDAPSWDSEFTCYLSAEDSTKLWFRIYILFTEDSTVLVSRIYMLSTEDSTSSGFRIYMLSTEYR